jgi:hypothetical protein
VRVYCCFLFMLLVCLISNLFFCPSNWWSWWLGIW